MLMDMMTFMPSALSDLWDTLVEDWVGPAYVIVVAFLAFPFLKNRAWLQLLAFVAMAAVVGLLIFAGDSLFGSEDATVTGIASDSVEELN